MQAGSDFCLCFHESLKNLRKIYEINGGMTGCISGKIPYNRVWSEKGNVIKKSHPADALYRSERQNGCGSGR